MTELTLGTELTGEQREYLETVKESGDSLLGLINDLLDFSKIEAGRLGLESVTFEVPELLQRTLKPLALRARQKGLELTHEIEAGVPDWLTGDPLRLQQVLINLVGNAIKFTERGWVRVAVGGAPLGADEVVLRFSVADSGIGIPTDRRQVIFEAFTQADGTMTRKFGGTGLGLAICARLAEMMGGSISVESGVGEGSTFHFTARLGLAARADSPPAGAGSAPPGETASRDHEPRSSRRPLRVLLAEDNAVNRKLAARLLQKWGHGVTVVEDGSAALRALDEEEFDLVLMDVQMPVMDGLTACAEIRKREAAGGRRLPVIALTAHAMAGDRERCLAAGMDAYLSKPVRAEELMRAIDESVPAQYPCGPGPRSLSPPTGPEAARSL
jgi:CheY-like chemotaxis protein